MMEKLVVENCMPSGNSGLDVAAISALVNANKGMSPEALMAMCQKQGLGGSDGGSLIVLILFLLLIGGRGSGLFGGGEAAAVANQNFDASVILRAIDGNAADVRALSQTFNCDIGRVNDALCTIKGSVDKVASEVGFSAERVINAVQAGNCDISRQIAECCCGLKTSILEQTNTINSGFAAIGFQAAQDKCEILHAIKADGDATRNLIRDNEFSRLRDENTALKLQASQSAQTQAIEAFIDSKIGAKLASIAK